MSYRYFSLTKVLYFGCVLKLCDIPLTPIFCIWLKWRGQRLRAFAGLFSKMAGGEEKRRRKKGHGCRNAAKRLRATENEVDVAVGRMGSRLALWLVFHRGSIFKDSFICLILREFVSVLFEGVCLCLIICMYIYICFVFHPCLSEVIFPVLYDISVSVVSNLLFVICLFNCLRLPINCEVFKMISPERCRCTHGAFWNCRT